MSRTYSPKKLYKYFPPDRISTLESATLRYTPLGDFNDPFEGRPTIVDLIYPEKTLEVFLNEHPEERIKIYEKLPQETKNNIKKNDFVKINNGLEKSKQTELIRLLEELLPSIIKNFYRGLNGAVGILCLTEIPDNILMWSHYSDSHSGFAIEFNTHHPYFHGRDPETDLLNRLQYVNYQDTRSNALFDELEPKDFFLTKSSHWMHEREWRIIRKLEDADQTIQKEPFPVNLFKFPREAITSIILGARSSKATEELIKEILNSHPEYKSVSLKRAEPSESQFTLHINKIKR